MKRSASKGAIALSRARPFGLDMVAPWEPNEKRAPGGARLSGREGKAA